MTDTCRRKPPSNETFHTVPRQVVALTASAQNCPPQIAHCHAKGSQCRAIHGHTVVVEVTQQDRAQISPLFRDGRVHALPQFDFQFPQLGLPPLPHRLPQHREPPLPRLCATVREAQEVEGLRFAVATVSPISFRIAAELDDPRFVGMQFQAELRESLAQFRQEPLCLMTMLKSHDEIIGKADDDHVAVRLLLPPSLGPKVEHIVQIEVRQQRTDASALNRPHLTLYSLAPPPARPP